MLVSVSVAVLEGYGKLEGPVSLGNGDEVRAMRRVDQSVIEVLVVNEGGMKLAMIHPNIGAFLKQISVRRVVARDQAGEPTQGPITYLDLQRISVVGLDKRRHNVPHNEVALTPEVEANALEAWRAAKSDSVRSRCAEMSWTHPNQAIR